MNWSFQLFSARNTPLTEALSIVAAAGYHGVESFRDNYSDVDAFRKALDDSGLALPSMHINIEELRDNLAGCIQRARDFGATHVACPYLDIRERPTDSAGWKALAIELNELAGHWNDAGIAFSWHNHDFEFLPMADGALPIDVLFDNAPELKWEIDVAWVVRSGDDPARWIRKYTDRLSAVHVKDIAPAGECEDEDGWADVGYGVVPWAELMPMLLTSPAAVYVIEHDNPSDLQRFATRSIASAEQLLKTSDR